MSMLNIGKKLDHTQKHKLTEAKADTQKLIDFAGQDLANRFLNIKNKLKAPENDLYYWIKNKTPEELDQFISKIEGTKSKTQVKKDIADQGAQLICDSEHWRVYHITTFEAAQKYGRDSQWCITGVNNYGDRYWNDYTGRGVEFYFAITKENYNPRGEDSKFAIAVYSDSMIEIYDQQDSNVNYSDVPHFNEIEIPGVDLRDARGQVWYCTECSEEMGEDDYYMDPDGNVYCEDCFFDVCFFCDECREADYIDNASTDEYGTYQYCHRCEREFEKKEAGHDYQYLDYPRITGFSIGVGNNKRVEKYNLHVEEALEEILKFIEGLTQEEKDRVDLFWRCVSPDKDPHREEYWQNAYEGELIVSVYAPEELEGLSEEEYIEERVLANYYEAEDKIRKALNFPANPTRVEESVIKKLKESYSVIDDFRAYEKLWD